jgi:hypothetical protein
MAHRTFVHCTVDWGHGIEVAQQDKLSVLFFDKAGEKRFVVAKALETNTLKAVTLPPAEVAALLARAEGRKRKAGPASATKKKPTKKALKPGVFATLADQLKLFETLFVGGFVGERFSKEERGTPGASGAEGYKEAGIALARELLSAKAFASETNETLFENARKVLAQTNIAHPVFEGNIPFKSIPEADRAAAVAGLKDVLHGTGDYGERLSRFAATLNLRDSKGAARKVAWPLATVFGALFDPANNTAVKPTAFSLQARTLGFEVDRSQKIDAQGYAKFLEVATKTRDALVAAGHQPRDLLDVYTFIWRTHAEKPAPPEVPA